MNNYRSLMIPLSLLILASIPALGQEEETTEQPQITFHSIELATGLYMIEGTGGFSGGNVGLLEGEDGVALIDDTFPPLTELMLATVQEITTQSVDFVINTHYHGDHAEGNLILGPTGSWIVAHDNVRQRLKDSGFPMGGGEYSPAPNAALPVLTFAEEVAVHLNGHTMRVFHLPAAHTDGDAGIFFEEANVIHTGDVYFNHLFAFIDSDSGGTLDGYIAAQKRLLELADEHTKIIPGHGHLASASDLKQSIDLLETGKARVAALMEKGRSLEEIVVAAPLADYEEWTWQFVDAETMVRQLYVGLGGTLTAE